MQGQCNGPGFPKDYEQFEIDPAIVTIRLDLT
jgi:hypothetical protein